MCLECNATAKPTKKGIFQINAKAFDPTHTTSLRNAWVKDMNRRFADLARAVRIAIIDEDCFGLDKGPKLITFASGPGNKAFQYSTSQQKVEGFMKWLNSQVDKGILETGELQQVGGATQAAWTNKYVTDSYKRGVIRARYELQKQGFGKPSLESTGGIEASMATPIHLDRLGLIYSRTYSDLKGITTAMDSQISRILSQGIADGDGPRDLARKIVNAIDGSGGNLGLPIKYTNKNGKEVSYFMPAKRRAEILARTEVIRTHHVATIQEYRNWGIVGVKVQAEFTTAGDGRVCEKCSSLQGKIYTLEEAEGLIPVHAQCRCIMLPTLPDDDEAQEPIRTKAPVIKEIPAPKSPFDYAKANGWTNRAFEKSSKAELDKLRKEAFIRDYKDQLKGFNIAELDADMNMALKKYQIELVEKEIYLASDQAQITYTGKWNGEMLEIKRVFSDNAVSHELFTLPDDLQGQGFAKDVLKAFYKQYQKMKLTQIEIYANIDVGGYAWGRYGFQGSVDEATAFVERAERLSYHYAEQARDVLDTYTKNNPEAIMIPMNLFADADFGKEMLLGKNWYGSLDLKDPNQTKRFEAYLNKTKK